MERVAIIGLGLMGGSLGLALKARECAQSVVGFSRAPENRAEAVRRRVVDEARDSLVEAVEGADLVVLCAPVLAIPTQFGMARSGLKRGCVVTDVGSTKDFLVAELEPLAADVGAHFIGSHPIAGSAQQGLQAARSDLFEGATVVVTPTEQSNASALLAVERFWSGVGARCVRLNPAEHDRILASTSHLPHLVAALLVSTVGRAGARELAEFCGSGFRDTSRVAEGAPQIWRDILATNRDGILNELRAFRGTLDPLIRMLEKKDFAGVETFLERSRDMRRRLVHKDSFKEEAGS